MEPKTSHPSELSPALPKQSVDEENVYSQEFMDLLSTFPKEKNSSFGADMYQYNGFWYPTVPLHGMIECLKHFQPRKNDVFLVTAPKSGTTWLKAIIYALLNRQVHHPQDPRHPLLTKTPHQLVPFVILLKPSDYDSVSNSSDSSTRIFGAHLPTVSLPKSVMEDSESFNCKIVYLCRDIKDTFVSFFHFENKNVDLSSNSLERAFDLYSRGVSVGGPVWDQIMGYWKESLERPNKVLFIRYEDMKSNPYFQLSRLALFLGKAFSEEEQNSGMLDQILSLCSFDNIKNLEVNKSGISGLGLGIKNDTFYRSGKVGDWKNTLTAEMAAKLDLITEEKFRGSGLSL
ncbi:cytosolic sulfotransferase 13-like [Apium graveolens]|uniref:cytosolic sulfotransferase 13-like n=1 Tax=Apium graveolens TaxID=4045 RepID=UPI003D7BFFF1